MSKSNKLNLDDLLQIQDTFVYKADAYYFSENELRAKIQELIKDKVGTYLRNIAGILKEHESEIYINKFALFLVMRNKEIISQIDNKLKKIKNSTRGVTLNQLIELQNHKKQAEINVKYLTNICRSIDSVYLASLQHDNENNVYYTKIFSSDELIKNKSNRAYSQRQLKKINEKYMSKNSNKSGIDNIVDLLKSEDMSHIYKDLIIGSCIYLCSEANVAVKKDPNSLKGLQTADEIHNQSEKVMKGQADDELKTILKNELIDKVQYVDLNKLLMVCAYRIQQKLDEENSQNDEAYKEMLNNIKRDLPNDISIAYIIKFDDKESEEVKYSMQDLNNCLKRFGSGEYISQKSINERKDELLVGKINISDVNESVFSLLGLTNNEIEQLMDFNIDNFIYGSKLLNYDLNQIINKLNTSKKIPKNTAIKRLYDEQRITIQDIIHLYENRQIEKNFFSQYSEEIDFSKDVNIGKINEKYREMKSKKKASENDEKELETIIDIYITINSDGKTEDRKDEVYDDIMNIIAEDEKLLQSYYEKGLIPLNVIAEWTGENFVERLFKANIIKLSDIESLCEEGKVSEDFREKSILHSELDDEQIVLYMREGYIKEDNIIEIFKERNIYSNEPQNLLELGRISQTTYEILVERSIEELEERTGQSFEELEDIDEIDDEIYLPYVETKSDLRGNKRKHKINKPAKKRSQKLIKKEARKKLLALLGCKIPRVVKYDVMGNRNPLYNYNFYILQKDYTKEKVQRDDIVIAERLHEDRECESGDAIDNATYVMKYEDYLILQGKQSDKKRGKKREMIKEVDGAVYVVNHRSGTWAKNLLKAITQVDMGQSLNNISQRNTRKKITEWLENTYYDEHILRILDLAARMDKYEEFTYIQKDGKLIKLNNNSDPKQIKPVGNSTDDDTDGR